MTKRSLASEDSDDDDLQASSSETRVDSPQTKKRRFVEFEPVRICSIGSVKEIENSVLRAQHYKLCERFRYKQKIQLELEKRIEEFERRQVQDDAVNCIINRYWNRFSFGLLSLDADIQLLLQQFTEGTPQLQLDTEMKDETSNSSSHGKHFLNLLAQWSCDELDDKMKQRVEFSQRAIAKVGKDNENKATNEETDHTPKINEELQTYATSVFEENTAQRKILNDLQTENNRLNIQSSSNDDKIALLESKVETLNNEVEDLRCKLLKSMRREEKLDFRLAERRVKNFFRHYIKKENRLQVQETCSKNLTQVENGGGGVSVGGEEVASLSKSKLEEMQQDLEIQTDLANNRLTELKEILERNKSLSAEVECCKMKMKYISPDDIKNSIEYQSLQTLFSSLFEDCKLQKKEIEDLRQSNSQLKQSYEDRISSMQIDETTALERFQQTLCELDQDLNLARKEYENVCVDYEVNTISKEQAIPIQEQVNSLMNTLSTQNTQLKQEVARLKRKCQEAIEQLNMIFWVEYNKDIEGERRLNNDNYIIIKLEENVSSNSINIQQQPISSGNSSENSENLGYRREEPISATNSQNGDEHINKPIVSTNRPESSNSHPSRPCTPADVGAELQRLRIERDRFKEKLRQLARTDLHEKRKFWTEEQKRKLKHLEEQNERLRRELQSAKQEEDGLMQEMESIGQAFEELQEQNKKLLEQLREKEDVNLKLMSERIKSTQAQKKIKDEKDLLSKTIQSMENQFAAKMLLCQKMEEKERILIEQRNTLEHELRIREQHNESLRKKASEFSQLSTDSKLRLERLDVQFNELRENVIKKASTHEADANKIKRLEEGKKFIKKKA
ncbi:E3 ubiquitin protein ligase [Meloidogyne graminicola]|uniref:E3 ubiquitin protein ligase n=1 Tax=Meloidogyne graminicola TaxID=189291 RepID=A0A8S9ZYI8_9BILA|nr:E3 ubiquitin protein ligase [Meloidogyne graminicola]